MTINWRELTDGYNRIHGTQFRSEAHMLAGLYLKKTLAEMETILGVSTPTISSALKRHGIKVNARGNRTQHARKRLQDVPGWELRSPKFIAQKCGCSLNYAHRLKREAKEAA